MAAGLGFKTFTTGEVLTAGDVNGYLMQGINVFATTTARNAAITAPAEGQFAFTKDTNSLWYYDGAAWVASGATGDIEGVTAGTGLSGGGTSGTVTLAIDTAVTVDVSTAQTLTNKTLTAPIINLSLNAQTSATYTFVLGDNGKLVTASNASAQTYTIPLNSSVAYAVGAQINVIQIGAGQVTIVGAGGVTVASNAATSSTPKCRNQYAAATCIKVATDTWYVIGDIA
jgi:hypothetical protein